ncbi:MAG: NAD(P)H-hydrate dehydratase [Planctomycetes bacterium]|nr:NAD(P)H-hydrate dehydratase [Planctomycetota bacterium]MCP4837832.1 NAD(P)H-hydrate dehydratase [Planctomycetota bacterium]
MTACDILPLRPDDGHKGTFGTVGIIGGCDEPESMMVGAPSLAARAALRCGCGRVMIAAARSILPSILSACSSATGWPLTQKADNGLECEFAIERARGMDEQVQALAIGPGCGRSGTIAAIVQDLLSGDGGPLVVDADALHAMAATRTQSHHRQVVLTPHPGEFRVLARAFGTAEAGQDDRGRRAAAIELAGATDAVVVLKGHGTVVATGEGAWTCPGGGVELAIPGSGDVLTGIMASVLAQQVAANDLDLVGAARLAVTLHAGAGVVWREAHGDRGMLAEELADAVPAAAR